MLVSMESGPDLAHALDALLPREPELAYANFAPVQARPGAACALHRERWLAEAGRIGSGALVARGAGGEPVGALRLETRGFESEHFGLAMASIPPPLAAPDAQSRAAALRALYPAAFDLLRSRGIAHVAVRSSTHDRECAWVLQECGAFHVDTQVSWMAPLDGRAAHALDVGLRADVLDRAGLAALDPARWKQLADWGASAFDRGPLVFDRTLDEARARSVYRAWTERVMRGEWADAVVLAHDGPRIVAFISMLHLPDVSRAAGASVFGRGLGATLPEYRGLFTALQRVMIAERPGGAAWMENETQASTVGSINVYSKLGFRYLRSTASYHRRLDVPMPRCA